MKPQGNGVPKVCAENLLKITRGEVPYERIKGLDPRLIDRPHSVAGAEAQHDAEWLLETYEPRVRVNSISISQDAGVDGGLTVTADVTEMEV